MQKYTFQWGYGWALCLCLLAMLLPAQAPAQPGPGSMAPHAAPSEALDRPLMIIRFNQRKVYFERQLYTVVSRALQIKPEVIFDVLTLIPVTGDEQQDARLRTYATQSSDRVMQTFQGMGVPEGQVQRILKESNAAKHPEVHIFVQ